MTTVYTDNPHNYEEIESCVICDKKQIARLFHSSNRFYFYDACAFRKHVHMVHPEWWFEFVKKTRGVIVLTRCILMELGSLSDMLEDDYIQYIRQVNNAGIKILLMYEEDLFDVLDEVFTTNTRINAFLGFAIKTVKTVTGTVHKVLNSDNVLREKILVRDDVADRNLYMTFFSSVRENKKQDDNLGEEMIAICVHILANIPDTLEHKYVVLTEDKGAIGLINKARRNSEEYVDDNRITVYSTPKIAQRMYFEGIINEKEEVEEILSLGSSIQEIKIRGSEPYDIEDEYKTMTCSELAEKIVMPGAIYINY